MASNELIVDDEYCRTIGAYFFRQGQQMDALISAYISILERVKQSGIKEGKTASALAVYISQAKRMNKQIGTISKSAKTYAERFVTKINQADQFLF